MYGPDARRLVDGEFASLADQLLIALRHMVADEDTGADVIQSLLRLKRVLVIVDALASDAHAGDGATGVAPNPRR